MIKEITDISTFTKLTKEEIENEFRKTDFGAKVLKVYSWGKGYLMDIQLFNMKFQLSFNETLNSFFWLDCLTDKIKGIGCFTMRVILDTIDYLVKLESEK